MYRHGRGFTLLELFVVIAILSALLFATPSFINTTEKYRQSTRLFELQRLLQLARGNALNHGRVTTLCGSQDNVSCSEDWNSPAILVFEDRDGNHRLDPNDRLIYKSDISNSRWHWRGSGRAYLRFRANGTPMEWGRFTLCPSNSKFPYAQQLVLNVVGRPYVVQVTRQQLAASGLCT